MAPMRPPSFPLGGKLGAKWRSALGRWDGETAAGRDWRIAGVLAVALATVFLFSGYDRGQLYRSIEHDNFTDAQLTIATNLSSEHGFLQFYRRYVGLDGELTYKAYHRYPLLGYGLIKLAVLPFANDLPARIYAARMLMLGFFAGAAVLAHLALRRLTGRRAVAATATLLAFSSYPLLYHSDMVATEGVVGLFAVMLAFHGIAVYSWRRASGAPAPATPPPADRSERVREVSPGFGQLCAKTCVAVLLDWHVYGLLLPLFLVALPHAVCTRDWRGLRQYTLLGAAAVGTGLAMLAFNFGREYHGYGGARAFLDLPSLRSALSRTGLLPSEFEWAALIQDQFRRLGEATLPWAIAERLQGLAPNWHWVGGGCMAVALLAICLPGTRHRVAWSALALYGMGWALPMHEQVAPHEFEILVHVGTPLVAYGLMAMRLRAGAALLGAAADRPMQAAMVGVAFALFVVSSWLMSRVGDDGQTRRWERAILADVQVIRRHTQGKVVHVAADLLGANPCWRPLYLTGSDITRRPKPYADFVVAPDLPTFASWRSPLATSPASRSLTPRNRVVFLYEPDAYLAALNAMRGVYEHHAREHRPAARSRFNVHRLGNALLYVGERKHCPSRNPTGFFLHVFAEDANDLARSNRHLGYANLDTSLRRSAFWVRGDRCFAVRFLPPFPIAAIRTGQYDRRSGSRMWDVAFPFGDPSRDGGLAFADEYERIVRERPLVRSVWGVHLVRGAGGNQLAFAKTPCAAGDVAGRFLVHVVPASPENLPADHAPFDNRDFNFVERGGVSFDDKCLVKTPLPGYDIASVRTGQYDAVAGELWSAQFRMPRVAADVTDEG